MGKRAKKTTYRPRLHSLQALQLPLLCVFFAVGAILAHFAAHLWSGDDALAAYLRSYAATSADAPLAAASIWQVVTAYSRYPLLTLLFAFCSFGMAAIPLLLLAQGFTLSFAAATLSEALGRQGVLLALAAFGIQGMITVVVTLLLALWSLDRLKGASERKVQQNDMARLMLCLVLLVLGIVLELTVVPKLILPALEAIR